jgi:hypothetical protein
MMHGDYTDVHFTIISFITSEWSALSFDFLICPLEVTRAGPDLYICTSLNWPIRLEANVVLSFSYCYSDLQLSFAIVIESKMSGILSHLSQSF